MTIGVIHGHHIRGAVRVIFQHVGQNYTIDIYAGQGT